MTLTQRDVDTLEDKIQRYADALVEKRDRARENAEKYVYTRDEHLGMEAAHQQDLNALYIYTDGAYGERPEYATT